MNKTTIVFSPVFYSIDGLAHGCIILYARIKTIAPAFCEIQRPFDPKQALHVVLRSSKARGKLSLLYAKNPQHIRELSGGIAMIVTGARNGSALARSSSAKLPDSAKRGFWDYTVFTRIVRFGKDFDGVAIYVLKNFWEAAGIPIRTILDKGYRIHEINEDGFLLIGPPVRPSNSLQPLENSQGNYAITPQN